MSIPIRRALYGALAGDTTLNAMLGTPAPGWTKSIYYQVAPPEASFPYVILDKGSSVPTYTLAGTAMDTDVWTIKGVDKNTDTNPVESIQARVQALLTDGTISISGKTQLYLRRDGDYDFPEVTGGIVYHHAGSDFRLITT